MAISTYAELKVAVQAWMKRGDILTVVDDFIDLAEADIWQRLRIRDMETVGTSTLSTSSRYLAVPTGFQELRKFKITQTNQPDVVLKYDAPLNIAVLTSAGLPCYFTISTQFEFDRVPDQAYSVEYHYFRSLTALSDAATSNAVLTRYPMIYLYGCLMHGANWALNDALFQKYSVMFQGAIESANDNDNRGRYGPAPTIKSMRTAP
jgi:hypothetical protein